MGRSKLPGLVTRAGRKTALPGWCVMSAEARASIIVFLILLVVGLGPFLGYRYASNSSRADAAEVRANAAEDAQSGHSYHIECPANRFHIQHHFPGGE
jgi:hypothetical protein